MQRFNEIDIWREKYNIKHGAIKLGFTESPRKVYAAANDGFTIECH